MKMPYLTIFIHLFVWAVLLFLLINSSLNWGWTLDAQNRKVFSHIYGGITNAFVFYTTAYVLVPSYFKWKQLYRFIGWGVLFLMLFSMIEACIDYQVGSYLETRSFLRSLSMSLSDKMVDGMAYTLPVNLSFFLFALAYRLPIDRRKAYERELTLQREKFSTELKWLKSQIHPHTLFNGMNSIYHLIDQDPEGAKEMILVLSEALRYHLKEGANDYVRLNQEIEYIKNYIHFNKIRFADDIDFKLDINIEEKERLIAPLLLTPFIENAFKFVSRYGKKEKNFIKIRIYVQHSELLFHISNSCDHESLALVRSVGIGLSNVKERLNALYHDRFELKIDASKELYTVQLKIHLESKS